MLAKPNCLVYMCRVMKLAKVKQNCAGIVHALDLTKYFSGVIKILLYKTTKFSEGLTFL